MKAPAKPLSITSGSASCPPFANSPPANRTMSPEAGRPKLSSAAPKSNDQVAVGYEQVRYETQYTAGVSFGMDPMKSRRLSMRRMGYTTPETRDGCIRNELTRAGSPAMLLEGQTGGEGIQEAGASPARSRHCNRGANPKTPPPAGRGKAGLAQSRESGDWPFARDPKPGRGPREGGIMEKILGRRHPPTLPLWSLLALALLLLALFVLLSASGDLARTAPGAGCRALRLPARVRPRRATPARRSLPLESSPWSRPTCAAAWPPGCSPGSSPASSPSSSGSPSSIGR